MWWLAKLQFCIFALLHFCTFRWESWHNWQCKIAKMLEDARTQTLHFCIFSGTTDMGKARMWWLAQAAYAKVHLHFCTFGWCGWHGHGQGKGGVVGAGRICKTAFLRFRLVWLAWVKRMAWLAQTVYANVQRKVQFLHKWYLQRHTFCTWLVRLAWAKDGAKSPTDH